MHPPRIAVTGATGTVGGLTARSLSQAGVPLRLLVRDETRAPRLPGAEVAQTAYGDPSATDALRDIDTVLMISAHESQDRVDAHRAFVEAAVEAGVRQVVYTSFVGAAADNGFLLGRDHAATEEAIRASGLQWTFLRDSFYAELLPSFADDDGIIRGPAGEGRVAAVSQRDVAGAAAAVLQEPAAHVGATYELTGPEALTFAEVADTLTQLTGRPHRFVDETLDEARASRAHLGAPDWLVDAWISTYTAVRDGELAQVSDDVPRLLGRAATPFEEAVSAVTGSARPAL